MNFPRSLIDQRIQRQVFPRDHFRRPLAGGAVDQRSSLPYRLIYSTYKESKIDLQRQYLAA
jgi:hypothetical protein